MEDNARRRRDIQSIGVLGELAAGRGSLEGDVVKDQVLRVGDTNVGSGSIDDADARDLGVSGAETENSGGSVISGIIPTNTC